MKPSKSSASDRYGPESAPRYRVLLLPSWYPTPQRPTYAVFIQVQAEAIARLHQIVCVPMPSPHSLLSGIRTRCTADTGRNELIELRVTGPNYTPKLPAARHLALSRLYRRAFREAERHLGGRPHVIHAQVSVEAGFYAAMLAEECSVPLVLTEQVSRPELLMGSERHREMFARAMEAPDCVMCLSPMQRDYLYAAGVQREISVVPNMVDTEFFSPGERSSPPPPFRITTTGHLIERKGIHLLIEALGRLRADCRFDFRLDVIGEGEQRNRLEQDVARLELGERVRFHGEIPQAAVRDLLRESHFYVSASLTESFGVAILEAMGVGLPVVATRCGGPESFVQADHGQLVEPGSVSELAGAVRAVSEGLGGFDRAAIREHVVNGYSREAVAKQITEHYSLAIQRHSERKQSPVS